MKRITLLFLALFIMTKALCQLRPLYATDVSKLNSKAIVTFPDTTNKIFFRHHPEIKQLWVIYENKRPIRITPLSEPFRLGNVKGESFDLEYEGDAYAFWYKYGEIKDVLPIIEIVSAPTEEEGCEKYESLQVFVSPDSIRYQYEQRCLLVDLDKINTKGIIGRPAEYIYNLNRIAFIVEKQLANSVTSDIDSTVIFSFKVSKKGVISELKLEVGKQSIFSEAVKKNVFYDDNENIRMWRPAVIYTSGRNVDSKARIFAKLDGDGNVYLSATPRIFRFLPN